MSTIITQMPSGYQDFASYIHNQFDPKYLSEEENAAILACKRSYRFVHKPPIEQEIYSFFSKYFNETNSPNLLKNGLNITYTKLKDEIVNIAIILYGAYHIERNSIYDLFLCSYKNQHGEDINITINSACQALLQELSKEKIHNMCLDVPNIDIYRQKK